MKVQELIEILETLDPEAEVLLATQYDWPFENRLDGVVSRRDFSEIADDDEAEPKGSDVLLLEGEQLRYGTKAAWAAARS